MEKGFHVSVYSAACRQINKLIEHMRIGCGRLKLQETPQES
jgi:hypothetical protein